VRINNAFLRLMPRDTIVVDFKVREDSAALGHFGLVFPVLVFLAGTKPAFSIRSSEAALARRLNDGGRPLSVSSWGRLHEGEMGRPIIALLILCVVRVEVLVVQAGFQVSE